MALCSKNIKTETSSVCMFFSRFEATRGDKNQIFRTQVNRRNHFVAVISIRKRPWVKKVCSSQLKSPFGLFCCFCWRRSKVIYSGVLTTKPSEDRVFQFVYICFLLSNSQFIMEHNGSKLQFLSWIGQFDNTCFFIFVISFKMGNHFYAFELKKSYWIVTKTVVQGLLTALYYRSSQTRTVVSTPW